MFYFDSVTRVGSDLPFIFLMLKTVVLLNIFVESIYIYIYILFIYVFIYFSFSILAEYKN